MTHLPIYEIFYEVTDRYFLSFHLDTVIDNSSPLLKESLSIYYLWLGREAQLYRAQTAVFQPLVLFYLLESIEKVVLTYI